MAAPALLFIANFLAATFSSSSSSNNAVYDAAAIVGTVVVDLVLIGYVLFATRASRRPIVPTLALVRTPLRPAVRLGLAALGVIVVANFILEPVLHASQRQGIAPTHDPRNTHQWVVLGVAVVGLVLVAPFAEELVFRGLGFASLGRYALPLTAALFALAHGLPVLLIPVAIAGLALGYIRQRTGSVLPGMGVHMSLNALALILALLAP
ncbi:MAG TPA: CPBP family intramembrane glutamic endopeptidase [Gaiellales bacterium]|jgi:membrane protease YdiL (CAAX protease family)|nr:CPBP family intramembrane glutamic endopeptidase [Gaiellales bacterium]